MAETKRSLKDKGNKITDLQHILIKKLTIVRRKKGNYVFTWTLDNIKEQNYLRM